VRAANDEETMKKLLPLLLSLAACAHTELGPPEPLGVALGGELLPACMAAAKVHAITIGGFDRPLSGPMLPVDEAAFVLELRNGDQRQQWLLVLQAITVERMDTKATMTLNALDGGSSSSNRDRAGSRSRCTVRSRRSKIARSRARSRWCACRPRS